MDHLRLDLVFALRTLRKNPLFSTLATVILALGISANSITFGFLDAFLLRPLPFGEPDRLVHVWGTDRQLGGQSSRVSVPTYRDWREQTEVFEDLAVFNYTGESLTGVGEVRRENEVPERISAGRVSADAFEVLDVSPLLGRGFLPGEDQPGAEPVAVVGHDFWQERFGGDESALGQLIRIDGVAHTVVGVMPADFLFPLPITEVWLPRVLDPERASRNSRYLQVFGRLKAGVTLADAQAEMKTVSARLEETYPEAMKNRGARVVPLREALNFASEIIGPMSLVLLLASAFVLLIVCANLANLMLSRAVARGREVSIRLAVGADRGRLVRQMLTESAVLAVAGGALGILLATWGAEGLDALVPPDLYRIGSFGLETRGLIFTAGVALVSALLFGLMPALRASGVHVTEGLKEGRGGGLGRGAQRTHAVLVVAQLAFALVLLAGCSLMIRSLDKMRRVDPGFDADRVLTQLLVLPESRYDGSAQIATIQSDLLDRVAAQPGVEGAALVDYLPLNHETAGATFEIAGRPADDVGSLDLSVVTVTPDYFRVMGIPVVAGRALTAEDNADAPLSLVINEALARRYWSDRAAVGQHLLLGASKRQATIVGVVAGSRHTALDDTGLAQIYRAQAQSPVRRFRLLVRAAGDPSALAGGVRGAIREVDPLLPILEVRTLAEVVREFLMPQWSMALMLGILGAGALVLAGLGIYGVMAFFVGRRRRELAVRMALGARRSEVVGLVLRRGMKLVAVGIVLGLGASVALRALMESLLFQAGGTDLVSIVGVPAFLAAIAALACLVPARRASAVDPMEVLRYE